VNRVVLGGETEDGGYSIKKEHLGRKGAMKPQCFVIEEKVAEGRRV